jgi:bla regulator protein blaR1
MIISIAIKATAILTLAFVAALSARRSRASLRHGVFASLFVALLLLPVAGSLVPANEVTLPAAAPQAVTAVAAMTTLPVEPVAVSEPVERAPNWSWMSIAVAAYFTGLAVLLTILAAGVWRLRRWSHDAEVWIEASTVAAEVARDNAIRRAVLVVISDEVSVPLTFGFRRQTIVMPAPARHWDVEAIRRAIRHELEHVRRDDWTMQLVARVACAVYWPHPMVWMAWRRFCLEAERACDDAVVRASDASTYAEQLVALARTIGRSSNVPALAMASHSRLSERVHAILDAKQARGPQSRAAMLLSAGVMVVLAVTFGSVRVVAAVTGHDDQDEAIADGVKGGVEGALEEFDMYRDAVVKAAERGNIDALDDLLIRKGLGINTPIVGDGTPILIAARAGQRHAVQWLLDRGADPNTPSPGDGNALIAAAGAGEIEIMRILIDRGAHLEDVVPGDENALITASAEGTPDAVKLLIEHGANVNSRVWADDREWRTPLRMARRRGHTQIIRMLEAAGARD